MLMWRRAHVLTSVGMLVIAVEAAGERGRRVRRCEDDSWRIPESEA
jgi:hypothetical protein